MFYFMNVKIGGLMNFDPTHAIWVERYRPATIDDAIIPDRIKHVFKQFVTDGEFPALLLSGGAGIGKTTLAKALCNELGLDWIIINASNERGIDTLRTTITNFATTVSFSDAKIKCIIMDEFDHASPLLQAAMRAAIEDFSKTCRFIFTCNYPNKIIDAIHSRCSNVSLTLEAGEKATIAAGFFKRMCAILKNENVEFDRKAVAKLVEMYFPDFRRTINELQRLSRAGTIDSELVAQVSEDVNITKLVKCLREKDFSAMRQWVATNAGNDSNLLFRKVYDNMSDLLQPHSIPEAVIIIANYQFRGVTCPDPEINFVACCTELMASCEFK